jgi:hypothetical protein
MNFLGDVGVRKRKHCSGFGDASKQPTDFDLLILGTSAAECHAQ